MQIHLTSEMRQKKLGDGTQGVVYEVLGRPIANESRALVYKEFKPKTKVNSASLELLTDFRRRLESGEKARLDSSFAWPLAVVIDGKKIVGYLMNRVPHRFLVELHTNRGMKRIGAEFQLLIKANAVFQRDHGFELSTRQRFALAIKLAEAFDFLHSHRLIYGDLSWRNSFWSCRPNEALMTIDCDGIRLLGAASPAPQLHSPGWVPPEGQVAQNIHTDCYKLGLGVLRILSPGIHSQNQGTDNLHFEILSKVAGPKCVRTLRTALSPATKPENRPTAREILRVLQEECDERIDSVDLESRRLSKSTVAIAGVAGPSVEENQASDEQASKVVNRSFGKQTLDALIVTATFSAVALLILFSVYQSKVSKSETEISVIPPLAGDLETPFDSQAFAAVPTEEATTDPTTDPTTDTTTEFGTVDLHPRIDINRNSVSVNDLQIREWFQNVPGVEVVKGRLLRVDDGFLHFAIEDGRLIDRPVLELSDSDLELIVRIVGQNNGVFLSELAEDWSWTVVGDQPRLRSGIDKIDGHLVGAMGGVVVVRVKGMRRYVYFPIANLVDEDKLFLQTFDPSYTPPKPSYTPPKTIFTQDPFTSF